jgi:CBS domain-containing protein
MCCYLCAGEEVGQTLVLATPATTLAKILELIVSHRVHRVYIMEPVSEKPVGVVTCTDVLRAVVKEISAMQTE